MPVFRWEKVYVEKSRLSYKENKDEGVEEKKKEWRLSKIAQYKDAHF